MRARHIAQLVFLLVLGTGPVARANLVVRVKYLSAHHVYLDGGRAEGVVEAGQVARVVEGDRVVAVLRILHVAEHSAVAEVVEQQRPIEVGDLVRIEPLDETPEEAAPPAAETPPVEKRVAEETPAAAGKEDVEVTPPRRTEGRRRHLSHRGSVQVSWQRRDVTVEGRSFVTTDKTSRFSYAARDLGWAGMDVRIRARYRQLDRSWTDQLPPSLATPLRLYALAVHYDGGGLMRWDVGRFAGGPLSSMGTLDGAHLGIRWRGWTTGVFGGKRPELESYDLQSTGTRVGVYVGYAPPPAPESPWRGSILLGGVSESTARFHERDWLRLEFSLVRLSRFRLAGGLDLDLHRGWRGERRQGSSMLSNVYVSGSLELGTAWRLGLWIDQSRDVLDRYDYDQPALLDERPRQGARLSLARTLPWRGRVSVSLGTRRQPAGLVGDIPLDSEDSTFASVALGFWDIARRGWISSLSLSAYRQTYLDGERARLHLGRRWSRAELTLEGALRRTRSTVDGKTSATRTLALEAEIDLPARTYLHARVETTAGQIESGQSVYLTSGIRF